MKNIVLLLILLSAMSVVCISVSAQTTATIRVLSAERCKSFDTGFYRGADQEKNIIKPQNPEQLLLLVKLDETTVKDDFTKTKIKDMYLKAGDATLPVSATLFTIDKDQKIGSAQLLVAVPKDTRNFTLFVAGYAPTELTAQLKVYEVLKQR